MASTADRRNAPLHAIPPAVAGPSLLTGGGALAGAGLVLLAGPAGLLWAAPVLFSGLALLLLGGRVLRPRAPGSLPAPAAPAPTGAQLPPLADLSQDVRQLVMQMQMQA